MRATSFSAIALAVSLAGCSTLGDKRSPEELKAFEALSFDQFIDSKSPGTELKDRSVAQVYRAKRVMQTLTSPVNVSGFYYSFANDFEAWCKAKHGSLVRTSETDSDCYTDASKQRWLGAYSVAMDLPNGGQYGGHADFQFFRDAEMQRLTNQKVRQDFDAGRAQARQLQCHEQWIQKASAGVPIGTRTLQGLVIDVRPPLVQIQSDVSTEPPRWMAASQLRPPRTNDYCSLRIEPAQ